MALYLTVRKNLVPASTSFDNVPFASMVKFLPLSNPQLSSKWDEDGKEAGWVEVRKAQRIDENRWVSCKWRDSRFWWIGLEIDIVNI